LASKINLADKRWSHYGWAVSSAYAKAFNQNKAVLGRVKGALLRQKQSEQASMTFALSLLTVGVGGGAAGKVARWMYDSGVDQDAAKDVIKRILQEPTNAALKSLSPKVDDDVFAPSKTTPEEYTTNLFDGISYNVAMLTTLLDEVQWNPGDTVKYDGKDIPLRSGGQVTADNIKRLVEMIVDSEFINDLPPVDISTEMLTRKASLALWIGWALARDKKYWAAAPATNANEYYGKGPFRIDDIDSEPDQFFEQATWDPVRQDLVSLGVPNIMINAKLIMLDAGWGRSNVYKPFDGLYMWGFIQWAASPMGEALLFDKIPKNFKGYELVHKQLSHRVFGPQGWRI